MLLGCLLGGEFAVSFVVAVTDMRVKLIWTWYSFVDNFEWQSGFAVRFGMQYCNFSDPELRR